jgi:hypothetical protein
LLAHLLCAYAQLGWWRAFPFTEAFVLRLARRSVLALGRNAARRAIRRLADSGVLVPATSYRETYKLREPSGHRRQLWSVGPVVWIDGRPGRFAGDKPRSAPYQACVATEPLVKSLPWWTHPLFGNPDGRRPERPPRWRKDRWKASVDRWASPGHQRWEAAREAAFDREAWEGS